MLFTRFLPAIASVCISAGLWALGISLVPAAQSAYGTLICQEAVSDRGIVERLEGAGISGVVSESGQWVLLDRFDGIEQVPLDEYEGRLFPFDPRKDNYAEKLRSLFIHDDKRIIYIPAGKAGNSNLVTYEKKLTVVLEDIPYSFEYTRRSRPVFFFFALFTLAAGTFFIIPPLRRVLRSGAVCLVPCLPALAPLALEGAAGFAQASLLAGIAALFAEPCLERIAARSSRFVLQRQQTRRIPVILPLVLLICYGFITFFSGLSLVSTIPVLVLFCGVFVFSLWSANRAEYGGAGRYIAGSSFTVSDTGKSGLLSKWEARGRHGLEHRRFSPVPILSPRRRFSFAFSWAMLPFAAVALTLALIDLTENDLVSNEIVSNNLVKDKLVKDKIITEEDYYRHYFFQSTFSVRPLHISHNESGAPPSMSVYEFAADGLPHQIFGENFGKPATAGEFSLNGIPPFPLGDLVRYLETADEAPQNMTRRNALAALLPLLFILPALIRGRRSRQNTSRGIILPAYTRR